MAFEQKPIIKKSISFSGEVREYEESNVNPWFKGIPYEVIGRAGPIIAVKTHKQQNMPPVIFFDGRHVNFIEINKEYYDSYWKEFLAL